MLNVDIFGVNKSNVDNFGVNYSFFNKIKAQNSVF